jgi:hypothetical protein
LAEAPSAALHQPPDTAPYPASLPALSTKESIVDSLQTSDAAAAAVANAPRVTLGEIEAAIAAKFFVSGEDAARAALANEWKADVEVPAYLDHLSVLTICILVMRNGFTIIGKSAPASPENWDGELGRKFAYEDAVRQIWPLMGFALRDRLHKRSLVSGTSGRSRSTSPTAGDIGVARGP